MLTQHWIQNVLLLVRTVLPMLILSYNIAHYSDSVTSTGSHKESSLSGVSSLDVFTLDSSATSGSNVLATYKLVGDNIDKNIKPSARDMRSDHQTRSHCIIFMLTEFATELIYLNLKILHHCQV